MDILDLTWDKPGQTRDIKGQTKDNQGQNRDNQGRVVFPVGGFLTVTFFKNADSLPKHNDTFCLSYECLSCPGIGISALFTLLFVQWL